MLSGLFRLTFFAFLPSSYFLFSGYAWGLEAWVTVLFGTSIVSYVIAAKTYTRVSDYFWSFSSPRFIHFWAVNTILIYSVYAVDYLTLSDVKFIQTTAETTFMQPRMLASVEEEQAAPHATINKTAFGPGFSRAPVKKFDLPLSKEEYERINPNSVIALKYRVGILGFPKITGKRINYGEAPKSALDDW